MDDVNTKTINLDTELISTTMIAFAGDAKANAFKALAKAKEGLIEEAKLLLVDARKAIKLAHAEHFKLVTQFANGVNIQVDILLAHAQCHLMSSEMAVELISEMIEMHSKIDQMK